MNVTQGLRRILQVNPLGLGTVDGDRHRTWREVGERVARLASALHRLGIQRGDRVAVLMLNSDRYLELYLGIAWAGAVIVPTNIRWSHAEIEDSLHDCRASMLVVDKAFAAVGEALAKSVGLQLVYADDDAAPSGALHYETLIEQTDPIPDAMADREDLAGIFYTGGTTGMPKGCVHTQRDMLFTGAVMGSISAHVGNTDVVINFWPIFWIAGEDVGIILPVITGATCVLAPDYGTTSWLAFYLPRGTCVAQQTQRIRWVNAPEPDAAELAGPLLYVDDVKPRAQLFLKDRFAKVEQVAELPRRRGPLVIETYAITLLSGPRGDVFDRSPPP